MDKIALTLVAFTDTEPQNCAINNGQSKYTSLVTNCFVEVKASVRYFYAIQIIFTILLALGFFIKLKYFTPSKHEEIERLLREKAEKQQAQAQKDFFSQANSKSGSGTGASRLPHSGSHLIQSSSDDSSIVKANRFGPKSPRVPKESPSAKVFIPYPNSGKKDANSFGAQQVRQPLVSSQDNRKNKETFPEVRHPSGLISLQEDRHKSIMSFQNSTSGAPTPNPMQHPQVQAQNEVVVEQFSDPASSPKLEIVQTTDRAAKASINTESEERKTSSDKQQSAKANQGTNEQEDQMAWERQQDHNEISLEINQDKGRMINLGKSFHQQREEASLGRSGKQSATQEDVPVSFSLPGVSRLVEADRAARGEGKRVGSLMQGFGFQQQENLQRSSFKSRHKSRVSVYSSSNGSKQPGKIKQFLQKLGTRQVATEGLDQDPLLESSQRFMSANYIPKQDQFERQVEEHNQSMKLEDPGLSPLTGRGQSALDGAKILSQMTPDDNERFAFEEQNRNMMSGKFGGEEPEKKTSFYDAANKDSRSSINGDNLG